MTLASPYKITWDQGGGDEIVLVAIGDRLAEGFGFPSRQAIAERKPIGSINRDFLIRNHWETRLTFRHYKTHANWTAAQLFKAQHVAALQAVGRKDLTLEYDDGASGLDALKIPNAVLETVEPKLDDKKLRTVTSYVFRGGAIEVVP